MNKDEWTRKHIEATTRAGRVLSKLCGMEWHEACSGSAYHPDGSGYLIRCECQCHAPMTHTAGV